MRYRIGFAAIWIGLSILPNFLEARQWTDVKGRTIEAEFLSAQGGDVTLSLPGGRTATFPIARLSPEDQQFVRDSIKSGAGANGAGDEVLNFDAAWPKDVRYSGDPQVRTVAEDTEGRKFVYESTNFRFISDVRLSQQVVRSFSVMFEATHDFCRALPLALSGGIRTDGRFQILLFERKEDYIKAGGPPASAGVFVSGLNAVMVPLENLGLKKVGSGYMLDREASNRTIIHELTHQLTPESYFKGGANGWFFEGLAEYVAATPYRSGCFRLKSNFEEIVEYFTAHSKRDNLGRAMGRAFTAPALRDFMLMGYEEFLGRNGHFNYGFSLMLTTYFLHLDGKGDATRMKAFLKALRAGLSGEAALEVLLDGRSFDQLQEEFAKAWKRKGVEVMFENQASARRLVS